MATHKDIDRICLAAALAALVLAVCFMGGGALGIQPLSRSMAYETELFDASRVHTVDLTVDDWDGFLETCENEEYTVCAVVIDGRAYRNVGLRAKGNTSLNTVSRLDSSRYSFKLDFGRCDSGGNCQGLDKLCLNNLIQDNTYMKDYLTYRLMAEYGASSPLCSYARITVNGEDWGLYLAVEGVGDSFLRRNYGADHGALYKPDSMIMGGGRGNGREFRIEDLNLGETEDRGGEAVAGRTWNGGLPAPPENAAQNGDLPTPPEDASRRENFPMGGGPGGMGASDVKLKYTDDDPASYSNIFETAKTKITESDRTRLIQALKRIGEGDSGALDTDAVLRYLVVHNFVVNGDSYTGSMVHNYYLYEEDGRLSMIPWDYNLAFGTFQALGASQAVNDPIDTPLSCAGDGDRPMMDWVLSDPESLALYHRYFQEFLETADPEAIIQEAYDLIRESVEWDPTKFCTAEEFETGVQSLKTFCALRRESVAGQLAGTIPSTREGQQTDSSALTDVSGLTLSDMGSMNMGGGAFPGGEAPNGAAPDGAPSGIRPFGGQTPGQGDPNGTPVGGRMPNGDPSAGASAGEQNVILLCLLSGLVLLGGLLAAVKWKHDV